MSIHRITGEEVEFVGDASSLAYAIWGVLEGFSEDVTDLEVLGALEWVKLNVIAQVLRHHE